MTGLSLLTLNIGNPSAERAARQLTWLASRDEHVLVLTETKASAGCTMIADAFSAAGWAVAFPRPDGGDYGSMILSRIPAVPVPFGDQIGYLPSRAAALRLGSPPMQLLVTGLYVPSRDASPGKTERKRRWLAACDTAISGNLPALLLGDLNILEPGHQPHYRFFAPFEYDFYEALVTRHRMTDAFRHLHPDLPEYSWVGRTGDGYRYDHAFCASTLRDTITRCEYVHEPRLTRLSDHSALTIRLAVPVAGPLPVTGLLTSPAPATLF